MRSVLSVASALSVAPAAPDSGLFAAVIVAAGVTALVAIGMMVLALHRSSRLTAVRALATAGLGLGVVTVAAAGVLAVSPAAQATPDRAGPTYVVSSTDDAGEQLPTLALD